MPKPTKIVFPGRSTGMGAKTQYHIFSLRQKKWLYPHRTFYSRTGNHWDDIWFLLPGKYFVAWQDISNSGKHRCGYGLLVVSEGGYEIKKWEGEPPEKLNFVCWCLEKPETYE